MQSIENNKQEIPMCVRKALHLHDLHIYPVSSEEMFSL